MAKITVNGEEHDMIARVDGRIVLCAGDSVCGGGCRFSALRALVVAPAGAGALSTPRS